MCSKECQRERERLHIVVKRRGMPDNRQSHPICGALVSIVEATALVFAMLQLPAVPVHSRQLAG